jgi:uncharacterized membrane protein (DUF373 family)
MSSGLHKIPKFSYRGQAVTLFWFCLRALLCFLIVIALSVMAVILYTFIRDFPELIRMSEQEIIKRFLGDAIGLLAVVEIIKTVIDYLVVGRVKVSEVIDTVLILTLKDVVLLWIDGPSFTKVASMALMIAVLVAARSVAIQVSPSRRKE